MTAAEYLYERQRLYRRYMYLLDILRDRQSAMLDAVQRAAGENPSDETLDRLVAQRERGAPDVEYDQGYANRAHDIVAGHMSDEGRQILSRFDIAVGELETANFSATTLPVPGEPDAFVLAFTRGLSGLTYEVARHLFASVGVTAGDEQAVPELTFEEAARLLHARLRRFIHLGVPYGDEFPISPTQIIAASMVTTSAERFVYCHELGHVLLGHLESASVVEATDDYLLPLAATLQPFEQEYEADTFAWNLLGGTLIRTFADWQHSLAGMTLFFETVHLLENANDSVVAQTHPPARDRLAALHALASAEAQRLGPPIEAALSLARFVSERLADLVAVMPALPGVSPLDELLDQTAAETPPNYWRFQQEVLSLMSHSRPYKLCRALGKALADTEASLAGLGFDLHDDSADPPTSDVDITAARIAFNRLKLLAGTVGLYCTSDIQSCVERHRVAFGGTPRRV